MTESLKQWTEQKRLPYHHFPSDSNTVFWKDLMILVSYSLKLMYELALWLQKLLQHQMVWQEKGARPEIILKLSFAYAQASMRNQTEILFKIPQEIPTFQTLSSCNNTAVSH